MDRTNINFEYMPLLYLCQVLLSNKTRLQAAGHKDNDGAFRGLYSLSLTDGEGRAATRVRFLRGEKRKPLASINLPQVRHDILSSTSTF